MNGWRFPALAGSGLVLLALTGWGIAAQRQHDTHAFVAIALAQGAAYLLALGLAWRCPRPWRAAALILGVAAAMRIAVIASPPYLSSDVYRYVWDGRVIAAGVNPYRYIPADPHLAALRDPAVYPNINRANYARTIYPPAAEAIFFAVTRISDSPAAIKAAMVAFEAIAVFLLLRLLGLVGAAADPDRDLRLAPAAIMGIRRQRTHRRRCRHARRLGAMEPAPLAAELFRRPRARWRHPGQILSGGDPAGVVAAPRLAHAGGLCRRDNPRLFALCRGWLAGARLSAALPGRGRLYRQRLRVLLVGRGDFGPAAAGLSANAYLAAAAALLVALAGFVALRRPMPDGDIRGAALLAGAFTLLLSPHYPWYFAWLVVFACLVPSAALVWLTLASFLLYLVPVWPQLMRGRSWLFVQSALYLPFLLLAAGELWRRRRKGEALYGERAAG